MRKLLTLLFVAISAATFAQAPQGINYQAVIRDNGGAVLANQAVGMKVAILQGSPSGTAVYEESFSPTTSQFGLVNVVIGQGTVISGDFTTIDWSAGPYYAEVSADETGGTNYSVLGTQQLMSVPYSLYAETAENVTNDQVDDADADPNNEIQDISLSGTDLTISSGSTVDLSVIQDGVNDADADPNNEMQAISFTNDTLYLSNGGQVYLGAYGVDLVDDADADPTNELQNWSNLPGIPVELTDGDDVDDADADPNNEIQAISFSNDTLYLSNGGQVYLGAYGVDLVNDADADPTNELQSWSTLPGIPADIADGDDGVSYTKGNIRDWNFYFNDALPDNPNPYVPIEGQSYQPGGLNGIGILPTVNSSIFRYKGYYVTDTLSIGSVNAWHLVSPNIGVTDITQLSVWKITPIDGQVGGSYTPVLLAQGDWTHGAAGTQTKVSFTGNGVQAYPGDFLFMSVEIIVDNNPGESTSMLMNGAVSFE